jgi:hypothetical protein
MKRTPNMYAYIRTYVKKHEKIPTKNMLLDGIPILLRAFDIQKRSPFSLSPTSHYAK